MALTKKDIVDQVAANNGFSNTRSQEVVEVLLEIIKITLEKGDDLMVSGFGKFCVRDKKQRKGRNPATGKGLMLRKRRVVTFKCSGRLKEKIQTPDE